jgi:hypothetical protein
MRDITLDATFYRTTDPLEAAMQKTITDLMMALDQITALEGRIRFIESHLARVDQYFENDRALADARELQEQWESHGY